MSGDLVERLRQRLSDLEAIARGASHGPWVVGSEWGAQNTRVFQAGSLVDSVGQAVFQAQVSNSPQCRENAAYIAANGPDVVLRTIQAHRKILALHSVEHTCTEVDATDLAAGRPIEYVSDFLFGPGECQTFEALASIYFPEGTPE